MDMITVPLDMKNRLVILQMIDDRIKRGSPVFWNIMEAAKVQVGFSEGEIERFKIKVDKKQTSWDKDCIPEIMEYRIPKIVIDEIYSYLMDLNERDGISEGIHKFALLIRDMKQSALQSG